jgi:proteasome lid subunit RPN8/RPN11
MSFSIAAIIRRLFAPAHEVSCSRSVWAALVSALRERGAGVHESGAFLLGHREPCGRARITEFVLYDDLDPHSLDSGIVRFDGRYFGALWERCRRTGVTVVADVHTHPWGAEQSNSDRAHPMITRAGHLAFILPRFARGPLERHDIGIYKYAGGGKWTAVPRNLRRSFLHLGL